MGLLTPVGRPQVRRSDQPTRRAFDMHEKHSVNFWIGNLLLGLALVSLFFLGRLWELMGVWAMGLWMVLAGAGVYFLMTDKDTPSSFPD